jgi:hypothetical protein
MDCCCRREILVLFQSAAEISAPTFLFSLIMENFVRFFRPVRGEFSRAVLLAARE